MRSTRKDELISALQSVGVREGLVVLCHSQLTGLGKMQGGVQGAIDCFVSVLSAAGTLIAPTFTYSAFAGKTYDVAASPSTVGGFGNGLRLRSGSIRSRDPNFSHAAIGLRAREMMSWHGEASIGPGSFYQRFSDADGLVVLLGVDFRALPVFMHMERMLELPYRYDKKFAGIVRDERGEVQATAIHAVRDERTQPNTERSRIGAIIDRDETCRHVKLGGADLRAVPVRVVERIVRDQVAIDPHILLHPEQPFLKG